MTQAALEDLKFPIGTFNNPSTIKVSIINDWISDIENLPNSITKLVEALSVEQLNYSYRPDGWTIKQVVHHLSDSHMNAFIRFKLALTEDSPIIKPYYEERWATLIDGDADDLSDSLLLIKSLHSKWSQLLKTFTTDHLKRTYTHPAHAEKISLEEAIGMYAWHGNHHLAHIEQALLYKGKFYI